MSDRKQYVLCFPQQVPYSTLPEVVLIERRNEPHAGKLNLPGGKIHEGETPEQAAVRELQEETGLKASLADTRLLGSIEGTFGIVHVCYCPYRSTPALGPSQEARTLAPDEGQVLTMSVSEALSDPLLIPNLRVIIPLCIAKASGWRISDFDNGVFIELYRKPPIANAA
jgi:8-oxo-dGTP pyrophosphatase MutT (NUDIX family)